VRYTITSASGHTHICDQTHTKVIVIGTRLANQGVARAASPGKSRRPTRRTVKAVNSGDHVYVGLEVTGTFSVVHKI
jgi:hypothetical protein